MSEKRIAVITGANRGIGKEMCRELAQNNDIQVILTARDQKKGQQACEDLNKENLDVEFLSLDVSDKKSIDAFSKEIEGNFKRCDILVNNAGIFPDSASASGADWPSILDSDIEVIERAMTTNVYGPISLSQKIVPLMKQNNYGRIVNLSSGMGQLTFMNGHCPAYRISKTSINAFTRILADELKGFNILVNSMCPGWVKTDMGGEGATRSLGEGADTAVFLATLPDGGPTGKFFRDRQEFEW